jgi:chromosomal replication initiation ATPase DnaA
VSPQLPLPFATAPKLARADFIVAPANAQAVAFIDSWPHWPVPVAALYGPSGCGKSHLAGTLRAATVLEDIDSTPPSTARDEALFAAIEGATRETPVLLTGREPPVSWDTVMPDLASRFANLLAFPMWAPDDDLLAALARKLFADRQLTVPDAVIAQMTRRLERTPAAVRAFVADADARALAAKRPITVALLQEILR